MNSPLQTQPPTWPLLAWLSVALAGFIAPAVAILMLADTPLASVGGPVLAVGLMGAGMIAAAAAGRFWFGVFLAILAGAGLVLAARGLGMPGLLDSLPLGLAVVVASISFAARGALFARSAEAKGWWIAVAVVAGEAAIVIVAAIEPGALPKWLLALLPAQWANMAIQAALTGTGALGASSPLIALGGTATATLLVARLWPRRWPYIVMFSTWIGLSALVYHQPGPPIPPSTDAEASGMQSDTRYPAADRYEFRLIRFSRYS